jgi:hypothetical protein
MKVRAHHIFQVIVTPNEKYNIWIHIEGIIR